MIILLTELDIKWAALSEELDGKELWVAVGWMECTDHTAL